MISAKIPEPYQLTIMKGHNLTAECMF